jgi:hypothetical protein
VTATAAVGGPALTVYAIATSWEQRAFAATAQVSFASQATVSIALKGLPTLSPALTVALILMVAVGLAVGHLLAAKVPEPAARRFVVWLAMLGAAAAVVKGLAGLLST